MKRQVKQTLQQREEERERRDQEAREHAPWQDEAWSEKQEGEEI